MDEKPPREPYPADMSAEEWVFVDPFLTVMDPESPQRRHDPRDVFNGLLSAWLELGRGRISAGARESRHP